MKVSQWIRIIVLASTLISLTACHSKKGYQNDVVVSDANAAYDSRGMAMPPPGAQTSGLGEESRFQTHIEILHPMFRIQDDIN